MKPSHPLAKAMLLDPRAGDREDDASSPKARSLLSIAGSLLTEISLPKLLLAFTIQILVPGLLLGFAPLVVTAWLSVVSAKLGALATLWAVPVLAVAGAVAWLGGRRAYRMAEKSFWSLNALAVQPGYALCREGLRHLTERFLARHLSEDGQARSRAWIAAGAGAVCGVAGLTVVALVWPATNWTGNVAMLRAPFLLILPALANTAAIVSGYFAAASLVWGFADALMDQPRDLKVFDAPPQDARRWRVVHLSDVHVVGEAYGFRIESGRAGPRGNDRLARVFERLGAIHAERPLDLVMVTGDMTDAGRSSEWAEFLSAVGKHPDLASRMLILPGNHDLNIVDRANPARIDLPTSPGKRLRQLRTLSAMAAIQGDRVRVLNPARDLLGGTLNEALERHVEAITAFANDGRGMLSARLADVWAEVFPMVLPPAGADGLGVILLNSNADTHFSFTNALGLVSTEQARGIKAATRAFPSARWIVGLHHHLVEYPKPAKAFSERIGTALINGSGFVRELKPLGRRMIAMHGHRHIEWIGECGPVRIVSAPSPVMDATDADTTAFNILTLAPGDDGGLALLPPERVAIDGDAGDLSDQLAAFTGLDFQVTPRRAEH
jgi:hypothetical protein